MPRHSYFFYYYCREKRVCKYENSSVLTCAILKHSLVCCLQRYLVTRKSQQQEVSNTGSMTITPNDMLSIINNLKTNSQALY